MRSRALGCEAENGLRHQPGRRLLKCAQQTVRRERPCEAKGGQIERPHALLKHNRPTVALRLTSSCREAGEHSDRDAECQVVPAQAVQLRSLTTRSALKRIADIVRAARDFRD
jgi:hypothetical protein